MVSLQFRSSTVMSSPHGSPRRLPPWRCAEDVGVFDGECDPRLAGDARTPRGKLWEECGNFMISMVRYHDEVL